MGIEDSRVFKGPGCTSSGGECCSDPSCGISAVHGAVVSEEVDWPGCKEAQLTNYDFHLRTGSAALGPVIEHPPTMLRSLAEKTKLAASVLYLLFVYED
jgi:hypothetical protein